MSSNISFRTKVSHVMAALFSLVKKLNQAAVEHAYAEVILLLKARLMLVKRGQEA